jgi:predicted regulator of Ras-like GTPase activity (Roadblock/LC7/MglB family)
MSFTTILHAIVDDCGGALGAALMGADGIAIEQVRAPSAAPDAIADDVGAAGIEFGRILDEVRKASAALGGGALQETIVSLARFHLLFRPVDEETLLVVALAPDGNLGKARYLMRRHLLALRDEL